MMIMLMSSHKHHHVESLRKVGSAPPIVMVYGLLKSIVSKKYFEIKKKGSFVSLGKEVAKGIVIVVLRM